MFDQAGHRMKAGALLPKTEVRGAQLRLLCACGRRRIELNGLGCCRLCYQRNYHSWRWFGGLRDLILARDQQHCRACGATRQLIVHHRGSGNAEPLLITLCIRCHVRLHRTRAWRRWVPEALLELWHELYPGLPAQLQLPLPMKKPAAASVQQATNPNDRQDAACCAIDFPIGHKRRRLTKVNTESW